MRHESPARPAATHVRPICDPFATHLRPTCDPFATDRSGSRSALCLFLYISIKFDLFLQFESFFACFYASFFIFFKKCNIFLVRQHKMVWSRRVIDEIHAIRPIFMSINVKKLIYIFMNNIYNVIL